MIEYRKMDITTVERGIIAHGVNCQKRMGSGVAAAIKKKWPAIYTGYMDHVPFLGSAHMIPVGKDLWVANCYTQLDYGYDGKRYANLNAIDECFRDLLYYAARLHLPIFMPKIGCGLGGLQWPEVERILKSAIGRRPLEVTVCELAEPTLLEKDTHKDAASFPGCSGTLPGLDSE